MNFLYTLYFALPNFARIGLPGKAINKLMAMSLKRLFDLFMPRYFKRTGRKAGYGLNTKKRAETYIVSLTSFPARIEDIWITIETILRQSFKPDKIILWLSAEQFPDKKLPESLIKLQERGLTIRFCEEDLRSHKKYFYAMQEYPEANIITFDDDSYYHKDVLLKLIQLHRLFPGAICANRAHKITFSNGMVKPYRQWVSNYKRFNEPTHLLVPTGVGGVLYPPGSLAKEVFQKEIFQKICPQADDLWLKVNALRNNTKVISTKYFNKALIAVSKTQKERLLQYNSLNGGNDQQLKNLIGHFEIDMLIFKKS